MAQHLMCDVERYVTELGVPWSVVSQKTNISYNRLRGLRAGKVEPTFSEAVSLCKYCRFDICGYSNRPA